MPKLKINRSHLIEALTTRFEMIEGGWYPDTETGQILLAGEGVDDMPEDLEDNPRYRPIEPISSHESFRIMEDFVERIENEEIAERLTEALRRRKPFRRFKDALLDFPDLRERWFEFEHKAHARYVEAWCEDEGIEAEWVDV
jgi:hypothetical protein